MNYWYTSIFLIVLILSIGAVNAQENDSEEIISIESDNNLLSDNIYVIQDSNYDLYFDNSGAILENSSLCDGDTLLIDNVTNKVFNIDKDLNISSFSPQSIAINSTFVFNGINSSVIDGLRINNENGAHAIYVENANEVIIKNNIINADSSSYTIYVNASKSVNVSFNIINNTQRDPFTGVMCIVESGNVTVNDNRIFASIFKSQSSSESKELIFDNIENLTIVNNMISLNAYSNADNAVAIASNSSQVAIINNTIISTESYNAKGITLIDSEANISNNFIESSSIAIDSTSSNVIIDNNTILCEVNASVEFSAAIILESGKGSITNNEINYTSSSDYAFGLSVHNVNDLTIANNEMNIEIPSLDLYDELGNFNAKSAGLRIYESSNIVLNNKNIFNVSYSEVNSSKDSINGILVMNSEHIAVSDTDIVVNGHSYAYAITLLTCRDINVTGSNIYSVSDNNYASGMLLQDYGSYNIIGNYIFVIAPDVVQAIKSDNCGADLNVVYRENIINASSSIIYAAYLSGSFDEFSKNEIYADGDLAIGIASSSDNASISSNSIEVKGTGSSNVSYPDSIKPETVGIKIIWGNTPVTENHIRTNSKYCVNLTNTASTVAYNYLQSDSLFGDNSVYYIGAANVYNNSPTYDAFITAEDVVMYYKNGTRFTATLYNLNGTGIENETIILKLNGVSYNRTTDENGSVSMAINLNAGKYVISVSFNPGENYSLISNSFNITILNTIEGDDIVKIYKNDTQYWATFVDGEGNPLVNGTDVTFNINGVFYTRQINGSEGRARLNINLIPGEYIITATNPFNGEMYSNNITVISPIRDNSDIVKYFKNDTQFVATIYTSDGNVAGEGENVTFNINGVFYTHQTNKSGQVKLNINLQPGEYIITSIYNGCMVSNNIKVLQVLFADDLVKAYGVSGQFIVLLVDGQGNPYPNQNLTFNVQGASYTKTTDSNGHATLNIGSKTAVGTYVVTSSYNGTTISNNITIIESDFS